MTKKIGVDLGGSNLRVALIENNKILKYIKEKTPDNAKELLKLMDGLIKGLISESVDSIGVASPGPLHKGIIRNPPNLPLKNFNLKAHLQKKFNKKVEIVNDAQAVALAESRIGCKKKNFFILTLGTGIGGGIIINGETYSGRGYAGELGHLILNDENLEDLWQKNREYCKKCFGEKLPIKELLEMGNKDAKKIIKDTADVLGKGIASLINIFDPEIVILSGGIRETGNKFLNKIKTQARKYVLIPNFPEIKWTSINHPGVLGASLLVNPKIKK